MSARRGGRGGGRPREPLPRPVLVSKKLSWLLRHGAQEEGLALQKGGYANVQDVLNNRKIRSLKVTLDEIREIVRDNDKQRFAMVPAASLETSTPTSDIPPISPAAQSDLPDSKNGAEAQPLLASDWMIRATQGHSIKLEDAVSLLTPITVSNIPAQAVHGTTHAAWPLIVASGGLKPMGRNHVHFAAGLPAGFKSLKEMEAGETIAQPVISGMRKTSTILIFLDIGRAISEGGLEFGLSENGVVLTSGNEQGIVPIEYFKRVEDRTGLGLLVEDGKIITEAPSAWGRKPSGKR